MELDKNSRVAEILNSLLEEMEEFPDVSFILAVAVKSGGNYFKMQSCSHINGTGSAVAVILRCFDEIIYLAKRNGEEKLMESLNKFKRELVDLFGAQNLGNNVQ